MDSHIGEPERPVQNRLLALFKEKLKYEYLGNYEYRTCNRNIERKLLFDYLMSTQKWSKDEAMAVCSDIVGGTGKLKCTKSF